MKIDEAIKRFIDNAEYERSHGNLQGCLEFRQLAEWLAELKHLREQTDPCEDTISRRAAVSVANDFDATMVVRGLERLPSVHPEQKIGKWITLKDEYGDVVEAVCSNCGRNGSPNWKYCPDCGKLKEVSDGNQGNKTNR